MAKKIVVLSFIIFLSGFLYFENGFTASDPECIQVATSHPAAACPSCTCLSCVGSPPTCTVVTKAGFWYCPSPNRRGVCSRSYGNFNHASINRLLTNITYPDQTAFCTSDVCCCYRCDPVCNPVTGVCTCNWVLKKGITSDRVSTNYPVSNIPFETSASPHCTSDRLPSRNPTPCQFNDTNFYSDCIGPWICGCSCP